MHINIKSLVEKGKAKKIKGYKHYYILDIGEIYSDFKKGFLSKNAWGDDHYSGCMLFKNGIGKKFAIHILVAEYFLGERPEGSEVDHKEGEKHNNHYLELRYLTKPQNSMNRGKQANNTTGYKGVTRILNSKKQIIGYEAQLCGKRIFELYGKKKLSSRHTSLNSKPINSESEDKRLKIEAAKAYDKFVYNVHGLDYARFNFPKLTNEYKSTIRNP